MKTFICILFIAMSVFSSDEAALKQIYENRESLSIFYKNISFKVGEETWQINVSGRKEFLSLMQKPFTDWQKNKGEVFEAFFSSCSYIPGYPANDSSFIINNDLYVNILIELLQAKHTPALDILIQTSLKLLKRYSTQIKNALGPWPYNDEKKKYQLLALLDLTEKERMAIDSIPGLDRAIRARLGNEEQQDSLISDYIKEKDYRKKRSLVSMLSYVGSDTCIKTLIRNFNEPLFDFIYVGRKPPFSRCYRESIRYPILLGFRQSFPENPMFNSELNTYDDFMLGLVKCNDSIMVQKYLSRFKAWAKAMYNVEPVDVDPMPMMLKEVCMQISYQ